MDWWDVSPQRKRTKSSMRGEEGDGRRSERRRRAMRVLEMIRSFLGVRKTEEREKPNVEKLDFDVSVQYAA